MATATVSPISRHEREQQWQLIRAVEKVNLSQLFGQSTELTFSYDPHTKKAVLRIVDRETKEVVRQLPSEELLQLAQDLEEKEGRQR